MNILGINCIAYDSSCCLVQDGHLVMAIQEERLTRDKNTNVFPAESIRRTLAFSGLRIQDVDFITLNWNPWIGVVQRGWNALRRSPLSLFGIGVPKGRSSIREWIEILRLAKTFEKHLGVSRKKIAPKIRYVTHHLAHAASSYFVSGFDQAVFLSMDGAGEWATTVLGIGEGTHLRVLQTVNFPHSVGFLYQAITEYLGFGTTLGEGKVMGLAGYGEDSFSKEFERLYELSPDGGYRLNLRYFAFQRPDAELSYSKELISLLGPPRDPDEPVNQRHTDIAASLQKATERLGLHLARHLFERTQKKSICISGGVALNCVMNGRIIGELPYEDIFIQPAANDAGGSIGGAYYLYHEVLDQPLCFRLRHAYWGEGFSDTEIRQVLDASGVSYRRVSEPEREAARLITSGRIVGWFQGRMEFGPRALGNRSIVADPRDPSMKERINRAVKHRELFRPFAPAVLLEDAGACFEMSVKESPFMLLTFPVRPEWKDRVPSVIHDDGSARLQTVSRKENPRFWGLINEFKQLTGIPMLINTSFNDRDEPIVASPSDAIRCFLSTDIDDLILGDCHVTRGAQSA